MEALMLYDPLVAIRNSFTNGGFEFFRPSWRRKGQMFIGVCAGQEERSYKQGSAVSRRQTTRFTAFPTKPPSPCHI